MKPFSIETPCHEDWTKMQIARDGRHCLNCQKNVVDFTQMERYEILEYLYLHKNESVCGRIYKDQIDIDYTDLYVSIEGIAKQSKNKSLPFYLLTTLSLYLASCEEDKPKENIQYAYQPDAIPSNQLDTVFVVKDTVPQEPIKKSETSNNPWMEGIVSGNFSPSPIIEAQQLNKIDVTDYGDAIETHASFGADFESLKSFVQDNLIYPQSELSKGKKGVVFVQFDILENGKVSNAKAIKNTTNSEVLEKEALAVVQKTDYWTPAKVNDIAVKSTFVLPISFEIKKY
jgi:TonB family protein